MDTAIALWVHNHIATPGLLGSLLKAATNLGSSGVLLMAVIIISVTLTLLGRFNKAHIIVLSAIISAIASTVIKDIVGRPRPVLWPPLEVINSASFPSGHALVSLSIYGLFAYFLAGHFKRWRVPIYLVFGLLLFLIGLSRVYLGVHWPSDVLGGWIIGALVLWLMIWWYDHGGIKKTLRLSLGLLTLVIGIMGLVLPIIPGIPLIIAACLLIFSDKSLGDLFKKKPIKT